MHGEHGERWSIYRCGYADLAAVLGAAGVKADALIVDAPYSAKTHAGHAAGTILDSRGVVERPDIRGNRERQKLGLPSMRRSLDYASWTPLDVRDFVDALSPVVSGWWGSITDHHFVGAWSSELERIGLYTFQPLPCIERGATVRMSGDGPPSWTTRLVTAAPEDRTADLIVARPKGPPWSRWGVRVDRETREARPLPAFYIGTKERKPIVGGKPLWLMREIVGDYSAPGALVLDPCAGGGTTLVAAIQIGRRAIGCEPDAGRFNIAVERLRAAEKEITT